MQRYNGDGGRKGRKASRDSGRKRSFFDGQAWVGYRTYVKLVREGAETHQPYRIRGPSDVHRAFAKLSTCDRERFYSLHLDSKHQVCGLELVTQGVLDASLVTPREVYKAAILGNAAGLILVHNHPSGDPNPSSDDRAITSALKRSGDLIGIHLLDHVIIGDNSYFSFMEAGTM